MKFQLPRTNVLSFLVILVIQQGTSRLTLLDFLETIQRMSFEIPVLFSKKITFHDYDWLRALLDICLLILLYALLFDAQKFRWNILMQQRLFHWVGGMNFNCVYKEVSKDNLVHSSVRNRRVMWRWTSIFVDVPQISISFRFLYSCPCQ